MIFASHYLSRELLRSLARVVQTFGSSEIVRKFGVPDFLCSHDPAHAGTAAILLQAAPSAFVPVPGGWVLILAWRNVAPKSLVKSIDAPEAS
jgi:hypothetical protein